MIAMAKFIDKKDANIKYPSRCWNVLFGYSCCDLEINVQYEEYFESREAV